MVLPAYVRKGKKAAAKVDASALTVGGVNLPNVYYLHLDIADLSADAAYFVPVPEAATLIEIRSVIDGAVATADATLTTSKNAAGAAVTNGVVTITSAASAAGDVDVATPTAANAFAVGDAIKVTAAGGGSGGSPKCHVAFKMQRA